MDEVEGQTLALAVRFKAMGLIGLDGGAPHPFSEPLDPQIFPPTVFAPLSPNRIFLCAWNRLTPVWRERK